MTLDPMKLGDFQDYYVNLFVNRIKYLELNVFLYYP